MVQLVPVRMHELVMESVDMIVDILEKKSVC